MCGRCCWGKRRGVGMVEAWGVHGGGAVGEKKREENVGGRGRRAV